MIYIYIYIILCICIYTSTFSKVSKLVYLLYKTTTKRLFRMRSTLADMLISQQSSTSPIQIH